MKGTKCWVSSIELELIHRTNVAELIKEFYVKVASKQFLLLSFVFLQTVYTSQYLLVYGITAGCGFVQNKDIWIRHAGNEESQNSLLVFL